MLKLITTSCFLVVFFCSACQGQIAEEGHQIDKIIFTENDYELRAYYDNERLPFEPRYMAGFHNFIYPGYESPYEVIISWQQTSRNNYRIAHYVYPQDASEMDFEEQKKRSNPYYHERNFLTLNFSLGILDKQNNQYYVVVTKEYKDSTLQKIQKAFLLKKDSLNEYKIATRLAKEEWESVIFRFCLKEELLIQLTKTQEQQLEDSFRNSAVFMEAYASTRSVVNNGFVSAKMIDYIRTLRDAKDIEKVRYFYDLDMEFVDCGDVIGDYFGF
ncbi:MAG TPA: hypothetical protein VJ951_13795 [Bacteroidales bacterium]|nr:hypothetical protein [Bacteroidales bacterium]